MVGRVPLSPGFALIYQTHFEGLIAGNGTISSDREKQACSRGFQRNDSVRSTVRR